MTTNVSSTGAARPAADALGTPSNVSAAHTGGNIPWRDEELAELRAQVAYWRTNYKILVRIIAEQHDDPALHWLDQIVHTRFSKLL